jgi:endonuclease YncB( thermonuclease family)
MEFSRALDDTKPMRWLMSLTLLLAAVARLAAASVYGQIQAVRSADSFVFDTGDALYEVRLVGVACPVSLLRGGQPKHEEARALTESFNQFGQLKLEIVGTDIYGRVLGWLTTADDRYSLNLSLVNYGLGEIDTDSSSLLNRATRQDLSFNQSEAMDAQRGVWAVEGHIHPTLFRQRLHLSG